MSLLAVTKNCEPKQIPGTTKCYCPVCDPEMEFPFSCHSRRVCGAVKAIVEERSKAPKRKKNPTQPRERLFLGDLVEKALANVGITKQRVSDWLGRPCKCGEKQERLNQLDRWARRVLKRAWAGAKESLEAILEQ